MKQSWEDEKHTMALSAKFFQDFTTTESSKFSMKLIITLLTALASFGSLQALSINSKSNSDAVAPLADSSHGTGTGLTDAPPYFKEIQCDHVCR